MKMTKENESERETKEQKCNPSDKGMATVVLNKAEHEEKLLVHIQIIHTVLKCDLALASDRRMNMIITIRSKSS